ncbi:hypothetical protein [Piscinibacter sp. XHJ-5]|uniref:hypothetical protein n=1 Tax=Piscinibacter sp. XHJ-5 TaxID=3037797 RepID=UPI0024533231|nr:hypothetical protein [Piscinibacter sp. XHJ-5]
MGRTLRGITDREDFDIDAWPDIDEGALPEDMRAAYRNRKRAIRLYIVEGATASTIRSECRLSARYLNRLVRQRCMRTHPDGRIWGWRALVPRVRVEPYRRKKPVRVNAQGRGAVAALQLLLQLEPDFAVRLETKILKACPAQQLGEVRRPRHAVWAWALDELRKLGYEARNEWPFNVASMGYWALYRHANKLMVANPAQAAQIVGGPDLAKKLKSGDGVDRPVLKPFERVEMDAHHIDGRFVVLIPQPHGGWSPKLIHRLWIIVLLEVVSRAVIGYHLSFNFEVTKEDTARAIKKALTRWRRRDIRFSDRAYCDDAALPSGHHERYVGQCWNETSVDGALAETCKTVRDTLREVVGSSLLDPTTGFAKRRSKDDRPFIESFNRALASRGLQRLSNTTGGKPADKQGRDPEKIAVISEFQVEYAEELLDVLVANYNATPHSGLGYRTPLQMLDFQAMSGRLRPRYADPESVQGLLSVRKLCIVRGGFAEGRAPYVEFYNARYSSELLNQRNDLVGRRIWVINHLEDDARLARASTQEGISLGVLRAQSPWHFTPHSLAIRSAIKSFVHQRRIALGNGGDAAMTFMKFVEEEAPRRKLPVHPAYLELRRILLEYDELRSGEEQLKAARARLAETGSRNEVVVKPRKLVTVGGRAPETPTSRSNSPTRGSLPPLRKAASG